MADIDPGSSQPPSPRDAWRVGVTDVAMSYRLFLGREPDSEAVLHERAGQLATEMLNGFVNSDEFRGWAAQVIETSEDIALAFMKPATREVLDWSSRFFRFEPAQAPGAPAPTLLDLVALALGTPLVEDVIDPVQGQGAAARLSAGVQSAAARRAERLGPSQTTREDLDHLYGVILGRAPEASSGAQGLDIPLYATTADFLGSGEFTGKVIPAALAGRIGSGQPLSARVRAWLHASFGIALDARACRQDAIVSLLRHPQIGERLRAADLLWSLTAVSEALTISRDSEAASVRSEFAALLVASGLFDPSWYAERYAEARHANDPLEHFLDHGAYERLDPGPDFDTRYYLDHNPDAAASALAPIEHYLRIGRVRGADASSPLSYARWIERFDNLSAADCERIVADAAARPLPAVTCFHIGTPDDPPAAQLGVAVQTRLFSGGVDAATHALDEIADGEIVLIIAAPCRLRPQACYVFAQVLTGGALTVAYCDHDHLIAGERREWPVFKPALSPDFLRQVPYAGPVVAIRVEAHTRSQIALALAQAAAGGGASAVAALLLDQPAETVGHVPMVLYSLPEGPGEDHPPAPFCYEPVPARALEPVATLPTPVAEVCILIPSRDHCDLLSACIDSLFAETRYPPDRFDVVVIDNDTRDPDSVAYLEALARRPRCRVVASPGPFNFAKICNDGAAVAHADILVFLNNDMTVLDPDWLTRLVAEAVRPEIGVVGGQLLYPDDTVQHGGVIVGVGGFGAHRLRGVPAQLAKRFDVTREMTTITGACIALRQSVFDEVGGFDPVLGVAFNDVALCMRVDQAGYRNLYIGQALLYHHESKTRGSDDTPAKVARNLREAIYTRARFRRYFQDDGFYSPNLSLQETGGLAFPPRVIRPWRRGPERHILILAGVEDPYGIAAVVAAQARQFSALGWRVTIGQDRAAGVHTAPGCDAVVVPNAAEAAQFAVAEGVDCIIAHSPPFFVTAQYLGRRPLFYMHDHGATPASYNRDARRRETAAWEKRFHAPFAERLFATSQAVKDQHYRRDTLIVPNGNDHATPWTPEWATRRADLRRRLGLEGCCIVVALAPRGAAPQAAVSDTFKSIAAEFRYAVPRPAQRVRFVLLTPGKGDVVALAREPDLEIAEALSDEAIDAMFAAADLCIGLQEGDGCDPALARAAAMGLDAIALDRSATEDALVPVAASIPVLCERIERAASQATDVATGRRASIVRWQDTLAQQVDLIAADVAIDAARAWL